MAPWRYAVATIPTPAPAAVPIARNCTVFSFSRHPSEARWGFKAGEQRKNDLDALEYPSQA